MKKDFDLLSLGEILLRLSPPNNERIVRGETFQKQVGGAELNVVSGVSLLGLRTGVISKLPDNALGTYAKNRVRFRGVSDDYLVYDQDPDARLGTTTKTERIQESQAWYMTGDMRLSVKFLWMSCRNPCFLPQSVSTPAELPWLFLKIPEKWESK